MQSPVKEYKPCKSLNSFVELFWSGSFNADASGQLSLQMIPNGCVELIIHLNDLHCDLENNYGWAQSPDFMILGLFTQPYEVRFSGRVKVFAIRFKPEGFYNIFGVPASEFKERYEDMTLVKCNGFRDFGNRIREEKSVASMINRVEIYLLKSLQDNKIDMSYVNLAAQLIRSTKGIKIDELSNKVFISKRQLEREFKSKIGISPKHYLRLTRINEVLRFLSSKQSIDLTSVAYHCGYFDQAHFIHDFKRITGKNPTIFIKQSGLVIANPGLAHYTD
jgi:AraC-like DNA-binding protein